MTKIDKFIAAISNEMKNRNIEFIITEVMKDNGIVKHGIILKQHDIDCGDYNTSAGVTVYLEDFIDKFSVDSDVKDIVDTILTAVCNRKYIDISGVLNVIKNFNIAIGFLSCKLLNYEKNRVYFEEKEIIFRRFLDLAIVPILSFSEASVNVTKDMVKIWGSDENTVIDAALKGVGKDGYEFLDIPSILKFPTNVCPMYSLTNKDFYYGASKILCPGILEGIAKKMGKKYWIIPSSVHECIIIPFGTDLEAKDIKRMIYEVNRVEVKDCDFLSNNLYMYTGIPGQEVQIYK